MQFLRELLGGEEQPAPEQEPASPLEVLPSVPSRLNVGWATDGGKVRSHNEDTALVLTAAHDGNERHSTFGLFVLADGMGGHQSGEVASSLAARVAAHHILQKSYLPSLVSREHDADQPAINEILEDAVQASNKAVAEQVPGGGTTLTCALVLGLQAYLAHVGDSRAYALNDEGLKQITADHSLVDRLIELGKLAPDEATAHPQKNVLYRAIGQSDVLKVDTYRRQVPPGEHLLLCSDGLWDMVSEAEMVDIIANTSSPQAACEALIDAANQAGGRDNVTVILWRSPLG